MQAEQNIDDLPRVGEKEENPFYSILFNVVFPTLIMSKLSSPDRLGPTNALWLGVCFPIVYGLLDYRRSRKVNFISILGLVSVLITGVFGIYKVAGIWFAVKEAAIPGVIGLVVIASVLINKPLIKIFLFNDKILHVDKIENSLKDSEGRRRLDALLSNTTLLLSSSFFLSAFLNFYLAYHMVVSTPGSSEYVSEIGKFTGISYFVIAVPCMLIMMGCLWWLIKGLKNLTGLDMSELLKAK